MSAEERIIELEQKQKENVASIAFLQGYIKGLEERISRLERSRY